MFKKGIVLLILLILLYIYLHFQDFSLIFVKSKKDDQYHLVRNLPDRGKAANLMAEIKSRLSKLVQYLQKRRPNDPRTQRLVDKFNPEAMQETRIDSHLTSFSIDKGEEIHMCMRDKTPDLPLHQINDLMFVALHEISHVCSELNGHGEEFQKNFVWILNNAVQIGIFKNTDYSAENVRYCGDVINSNPLVQHLRMIKK